VRELRRLIFRELRQEESTMQILHSADSDKPVVVYDLDAVISVGYRIRPHHGVIRCFSDDIQSAAVPCA